MHKIYISYTKFKYKSVLFILSALLPLGSCSQSNQLGMQPDEILERKFNDLDMTLSSHESITLVSHCAQLGEKNAEKANNKLVTMILGNTGVGKSTFCNYLMGCTMQEVDPEELQVDTAVESLIVVRPDSTHPEIMPIGHEDTSKTFMPKIETDTENTNLAYCDCPGFADNRGAEINIANAINTKRVLQKAAGVKSVFLVEYNDITASRGNNIRIMDIMCRQMFGGVHNLERHRNAVLLGITKTPKTIQANNRLTSKIKASLSRKGGIAEILAEHIFFFDPLDSETTNPDFWSREQIRTAIDRLDSIPRRNATALFQTILTGDDQTRLKHIIRDQANALAQSLTYDDYKTAGKSWRLLSRLSVIESDEVKKMLGEHALVKVHHYVSGCVDTFKQCTIQYQFDQAEQQLELLEMLAGYFPNVDLKVNLEELASLLAQYKEKKLAEQRSRDEKEAAIKRDAAQKVREEMEQKLKHVEEQLRTSQQRETGPGVTFSVTLNLTPNIEEYS